MKIGLISTIDHNIGDDFVREGIKNILSSFDSENIEFVIINKHKPLTVYDNFLIPRLLNKFFYSFNFANRRYEFYFSNIYKYFFRKNLFYYCNLIIQCGAPTVFDTAFCAEWVKPIFKNSLYENKNKQTFIDIAGGSCFNFFEINNIKLSNDNLYHFKWLLSFTDLITVRDKLAYKLLSKITKDIKLIPCTAFFASNNFLNYKDLLINKKNIFINIMPIGGHYTFDAKNNSWLDEHIDFVKSLLKKYNLIFVAHSEEEYKFQRNVFKNEKNCQFFYPKNIDDYFAISSKCSFGIVNRLHASIFLGSIGIDSIAIGNDSRLLMLDEFNNKYLTVNNYSKVKINFMFNKQILNMKKRNHDLKMLKNKIFVDYRKIFSKKNEIPFK
ncbi:polysaccharide pyruvyl transferase family protein [Methylophilaceae bacterium Uisw_097]